MCTVATVGVDEETVIRPTALSPFLTRRRPQLQRGGQQVLPESTPTGLVTTQHVNQRLRETNPFG